MMPWYESDESRLGNCEVTGQYGFLEAHHRKMRSQGGDDSPENIIRISGELHRYIHANPNWAYNRGLLVKSWQDPAKVEITWGQERDRFTAPQEPGAAAGESQSERVSTVHASGSHPDVAPGSSCPTCKRRVPHPKKKDSPKTKVFSVRVPIDDAESFEEMLEAASEHVGLKDKPHHRYWTILNGLVQLLQAPGREP